MRLVIFMAVVLSIASPIYAADERHKAVELRSAGEIAHAVAAYFPRVQGIVRDVRGDSLILSLSKRDGLMPGMRLSLWREGQGMLHPLTGAVIGKAEEQVGSADVIEADETSSRVVMIKKLKEPRPGDIARITPKKIPLALIPLRSEHREIITELSERLVDSGRFSVLDPKKVKGFIQGRSEIDSGLIRSMANELGISVVLTAGVYPSDGSLLVTANIYYAEDARLLTTLTASIDASAVKTSLGEIKPFFASRKKDVADIPGIPFHARLAASADLDGDGAPEWVLSDGYRLYVYREELPGWREIWKEKTDEDPKMRYVSIDVADMNGNGRPEVFGAVIRDGKVGTRVLEFRDETYRFITEVPALLRTIEPPRSSPILIGMPAGGVSAGDMRQYIWSSGSYVPGPEMPLPVETPFFGFVFADFGAADPYIVYRDEDDRIVVSSASGLVWRSDDRYPGMDTDIDARAARFSAKARVIALDIDGDGKDEIILARNIKKAVFRGYRSAQLYGMRWTGEGLVQEWEMKDIPGAVMDISIQRTDDMPVVRLLVKRPLGLFHLPKTFMASYSISDRVGNEDPLAKR